MDKSTRNYPLEDIDRETMFHPNTSIVDHLQKGPHIVAKARGVRIEDHRGRDLIDCGAGLWCVNIGYGRKEMGEAAKQAIENLAYYHIFGGALGLVNIDIMEREGLVQQAAEVGSYLQALLAERVGSHPHVGEVRGVGQMIAVEFVADKAARRFFELKAGAHRLVATKALELGVLTRALPFIEVNSFSPPLSMTRSEAEEAVERYGKALDAVMPDLARLAAGK